MGLVVSCVAGEGAETPTSPTIEEEDEDEEDNGTDVFDSGETCEQIVRAKFQFAGENEDEVNGIVASTRTTLSFPCSFVLLSLPLLNSLCLIKVTLSLLPKWLMEDGGRVCAKGRLAGFLATMLKISLQVSRAD